MYPIRHDRYGIPGARLHPHLITTPAGELVEFPGSVCPIAGMAFPVSGGGYFRLYPAGMTAWLLRRANELWQRPFMFYIHPWELDPKQPRLPCSARSRFRHYQNLGSTEKKLAWLLPRFRFGTMSESLANDCSKFLLNDEMTPKISQLAQPVS